MLRETIEALDRDGRLAQLDAVVISGDLTNGARRDGFEEFEEFANILLGRTPIAPAAPPPQATEVLPVLEEADTSPAVRQEPCPACGARRSGDDRYCEGCGHDFLASPPAASAWEAVANADRGRFERFAVAGLSFPTDYLERRFALADAEVRIGRSRGRTDEPAPEIDLAGTPEDPGISRLHAVLERQEDGTYALRDLGSTNGTTVNDNPDRIGTDAAVPLAEGDRIRLGAWTTITLRAR